MQIFLRTRGRPRAVDYQFLGEAPQDFWWRAYRPVTDIERPTILVRSDGRSWQAYIAGIQSARLDSTDIAIQYNLALAGDCGKGPDNSLALSVITASAAGLADEKALLIPGEPLDRQLPASDVERMLALPGKETVADAEQAVRKAYAPVTEDAGSPDAGTPAQGTPTTGNAADAVATQAGTVEGSWIGGVANREARGAFAALTARLLDGDQAGRAVALNLITDEADIEGLPQWGGLLGVLCAQPGPELGMAVRAMGKAEPPSKTGEAEKTKKAEKAGKHCGPPRRLQVTTVIWAWLAAAVVVAVLVIASLVAAGLWHLAR